MFWFDMLLTLLSLGLLTEIAHNLIYIHRATRLEKIESQITDYFEDIQCQAIRDRVRDAQW